VVGLNVMNEGRAVPLVNEEEYVNEYVGEHEEV
jgi:hypothetical protein